MAQFQEPVPAQSELYADFIIKYMQTMKEILGDVPGLIFQPINSAYGVVYAPLNELQDLQINTYSYSFIPKCYTYMDLGGLSASGITRLQEHPYLQLRGKGTVIAVIDSGIDYQNPIFQNEMGSRILAIWDQTLEGGEKEEVPYGRVFGKEEIDRALESENPLEVVPSVDTNGHGTMLAAVAAGLKVIVCVGEMKDVREAGATDGLVDYQTIMALNGLTAEQVADVVIAYEPVWAIGTGLTATDEQANETIGVIRKAVARKYGQECADKVRIQYGGSMNPKNVKGLMAQPEIDGGLIGGASLKAPDFSLVVNYDK